MVKVEVKGMNRMKWRGYCVCIYNLAGRERRKKVTHVSDAYTQRKTYSKYPSASNRIVHYHVGKKFWTQPEATHMWLPITLALTCIYIYIYMYIYIKL